MKKTVITIVSVVLLCACLVGTTYAWLMDKTDTITNTFTFGNIAITLAETKGDGTGTTKSFKIVPGATIDKDPTVTVEEGSEACWLFVKIVETNNIFDTDKKFVEYVVDSAWTELEDGVYYIQVDAETASEGKSYSVLNGNVVTVNKLATAEHFAHAQLNGNIPSITFTAYAVQAESFETADDAWTQAKTLG